MGREKQSSSVNYFDNLGSLGSNSVALNDLYNLETTGCRSCKGVVGPQMVKMTRRQSRGVNFLDSICTLANRCYNCSSVNDRICTI